MMKCGLWAMAAVVLCGGLVAQADTISYDASLGGPGFYNGTGNPDGGFKIDTNNGVQIGLRAKLRQSGSVIHSSNGVYSVPSGSQPGSTSHAAWNYEFSINVGDAGLLLSQITATLTIEDLTTGHTAAPVDALTYFGDDTFYNGAAHPSPTVAGDYGAQNSQNPVFGNFPLALVQTYDEAAADHYLFTLDVNSKTSGAPLLATDSIEVDVAPLPSTVWAGMALLGCVGATAGMKRLRRPAIA